MRILYKILLATDGSEYSFKALKETLIIATSLKAEVTVLCVVEDLNTWKVADFPDDYMISIAHGLEEKKEKILKKTADIFRKNGIPVNTVLAKGHPAEEICRLAEEDSFNLVIMGSRGLGSIKGLILGSVSNRVAQRIKTSILIVK